jgi:predicted phosphate transport protein (TIGR00153 family)
VVDLSLFGQTRQLISEIDDYLDKVAEAVLVLEQTVAHYIDEGADQYLDDKLVQIREIEARGDALRRSVANAMFTQMLMPDTRSDIMALLNEVDTVMDDASHAVLGLAVQRPVLPEDTHALFTAIVAEVAGANAAMVQAARAYFKQPNAIRDHTHKIAFHEKEATDLTLRLGRQIYDSDLPLARKQELRDWLVNLRRIASHADDIGEEIAIFGVKRAL